MNWTAMKPGDEVEVRFPARSYWMKARVIVNGGGGFWELELLEEVVDEEIYPKGYRIQGVYAEHVREKQ